MSLPSPPSAFDFWASEHLSSTVKMPHWRRFTFFFIFFARILLHSALKLRQQRESSQSRASQSICLSARRCGGWEIRRENICNYDIRKKDESRKKHVVQHSEDKSEQGRRKYGNKIKNNGEKRKSLFLSHSLCSIYTAIESGDGCRKVVSTFCAVIFLFVTAKRCAFNCSSKRRLKRCYE